MRLDDKTQQDNGARRRVHRHPRVSAFRYGIETPHAWGMTETSPLGSFNTPRSGAQRAPDHHITGTCPLRTQTAPPADSTRNQTIDFGSVTADRRCPPPKKGSSPIGEVIMRRRLHRTPPIPGSRRRLALRVPSQACSLRSARHSTSLVSWARSSGIPAAASVSLALLATPARPAG